MNGGLWRDHATMSGKRSKLTQADVIVALLREKRALGKSLELTEIMRAGIAQHGARFHEIRKRGFRVVNETDRNSEVVRSRYFLTFDPERDKSNENEP